MPGRLLDEFPPVSTERWKEAILKDLKGADYDKRLLWKGDDGITVKPFYRSEDLAGLANLDSLPGEFPFLRGTKPSNEWRIRERLEQSGIGAANEFARKALASGADEVEFVIGGRGVNLTDAASLLSLIEGLACPVHFEAGSNGLAVLRLLAEAAVKRPDLAGSLDYDPHMDGIAASEVDAMLQLVHSLRKAAPGFRPLTVNAYRFADAGATSVQELGYAIAAGIGYLAGLTERGFSAEQAASALGFTFTAGSNFFFEIAKLRAARLLWAQTVQSFGAAGIEAAKAKVHVRGSSWNKTVYDPYVNVLRGTTEAMSGAIGGCDSFEVRPFDECFRYPDEFSRRLARNTQVLLKEESWLDRAVDAAGGSYYVEALTDSLAAASWKLMQGVEQAGGFTEAWRKGSINAQIEASRTAKLAAVGSRRRSILGTNQYPNREERVLDQLKRKPEDAIAPRAAEVFEVLRLRMERHAAIGGSVPVFLLAEMGDLKMRKARAGFVANFFGCAGFRIETEAFEDATAVASGAAVHKAAAVVVCSSDAEYAAAVPAVIAKLREAGSATPVIVAGYPKDAVDTLRQAGAADFVHVRSNAAEVLAAWQAKLGIEG